MKKHNAFWRFWHYYILGEYHCDTCPYSWEERSYDGDCDAGCFLKGEIADESCRYIRNPISALKVRKEKNLYNSRYDDWCEYEDELEKKYRVEEKIRQERSKECNHLWVDALQEKDLYGRDNLSKAVDEIIDEWEAIAHPPISKSEKLKIAFKEWISEWYYNHIGCYKKVK